MKSKVMRVDISLADEIKKLSLKLNKKEIEVTKDIADNLKCKQIKKREIVF